jgi:hypothetical protein
MKMFRAEVDVDADYGSGWQGGAGLRSQDPQSQNKGPGRTIMP